jgi:tetratricopeptide (TPR) repeat protein
MEPVNEDVMRKCLFNVDNSNDFSKTQRYGFKFRNLNNPGVYYDEVHRRLIGSYRHLYLLYAQYVIDKDSNKKAALEAMDMMNKNISTEQFPLTFDIAFRIAKIYEQSGELEKAKKYAQIGLAPAKAVIKNPNLMPEIQSYELTGRMYGAHRYASMLNEILGDYPAARENLEKLAQVYSQRMQESQGSQEEYRRYAYLKLDVMASMDNLKIDEAIKKNGESAGLDTAQTLFAKYMNTQNPEDRQLAGYMQQRIMELKGVNINDSAANQSPSEMPQ